MSNLHLSLHIRIISPHQDDAAFSLALTIADICKLGCTVSIVNCFTVSNYVPLAPSLTSAQVLKTRHQEDLRFAEMLSCTKIVDLDFKDAPLRLGIEIENLCLSRQQSARRVFDPDLHKLEQYFLLLPPADLTFIPLALGGHIDHLLARDSARAAFKAKPIVFYQDLPYAVRFPDLDSEIAALLGEMAIACDPVTIHHASDSELKFQYISGYSTQASQEELSAIAGYPGGERLWLTERARLFPNLWASLVKP